MFTPEEVEGILSKLHFNEQGLLPAIAQQHDSGEILMQAWMNADSITETLQTGRVCYWSRSRKALWRKGETSGQHQELVEFRVDCDQDCLLLKVKQQGVACHTGRRSCFYAVATPKEGLVAVDPIIIPPEQLYSQ